MQVQTFTQTLALITTMNFLSNLIHRYWFKSLRKSYPWSAIGLWGLQIPFAKTQESRLQLYSRMHRAGMRLNFGELSTTIAETSLPQYWIF